MKKLASLLVIAVALGLFTYFFILLPEQNKKLEETAKVVTQKAEDLLEFNISGEKDIKLLKKEGFWWVVKPHEYLADQEFVEKAVQIMTGTPVINEFPLEDDRFGLKPGKAFIEWVYKDGFRKRMIIGEKSAPGNGIYVLDKDSNQVSVYHNVWGQVLYYPPSRFYHSYLPIPGRMVKTIKLKKNGKVQWSLEPADNNMMAASFLGENFRSSKAQWVWFFKKMREFSLKNLQFDKKVNFKNDSELIVESEKGNIRFLFNEKAKKIFVPSVNVFADYDPYSLNSLSTEIEKVMKSDKK